MPLKAVTFDFHNTIANCDEWFQLEVRELVPSVLDWLAEHDEAIVSDGDRDEAIRHYRALRLDIMEHGNERDAYDCTLDVLARMGRSVDEQTVRLGVDAVMRTALPGSTPVEGVVAAVRDLRAREIELAVVSSAVHHAFLEWSLAKFGILDCFSHVITSASCGFYKSRTEIYQHALDQLAVAPSEAVHVGDSHRYDVETATRAGMRTVWFSRGQADSPSNGAGLTVTSLEGLAPLILDHFGSGL
ncbi:MAG TPA: HAD family hydrolase [Thermomicrobiales bacterium]|nr:HAD family hydrolase [Thermomicrobiales bacterium]